MAGPLETLFGSSDWLQYAMNNGFLISNLSLLAYFICVYAIWDFLLKKVFKDKENSKKLIIIFTISGSLFTLLGTIAYLNSENLTANVFSSWVIFFLLIASIAAILKRIYVYLDNTDIPPLLKWGILFLSFLLLIGLTNNIFEYLTKEMGKEHILAIFSNTITGIYSEWPIYLLIVLIITITFLSKKYGNKNTEKKLKEVAQQTKETENELKNTTREIKKEAEGADKDMQDVVKIQESEEKETEKSKSVRNISNQEEKKLDGNFMHAEVKNG